MCACLPAGRLWQSTFKLRERRHKDAQSRNCLAGAYKVAQVMTSPHSLHTSLAISYDWVWLTAIVWVELSILAAVYGERGKITRSSAWMTIIGGTAVVIGLPFGQLHGWWRVSIPQHYYVYVVALLIIAVGAVGIEQLIRFVLPAATYPTSESRVKCLLPLLFIPLFER